MRNAPSSCGGIFDFDVKSERLAVVTRELEDPKIWDSPERAQALGKEKKDLDGIVGTLTELDSGLNDSKELFELARAEGDDATMRAVKVDVDRLAGIVGNLEFRRMFSNPLDPANCFIDIQAGSGGTEAQDWASMLMRMYLRYCERRGYRTEVLEESDGEVAGIKSASIKVEGEYAFGYLRTEVGVHRLVRKSPFDSNARRHTSFASVNVYPVIDDRIIVDIKEADVRTDTMRASGAGGQHVNKTESAIRLTHIPTNIVVFCQNDRSQHRNRAQAWQMLRARIYEMELKKREEKAAADQANKTDIGWGHQIRSYVLQPYQMVKDLRTGVATSATGDVLDGDLDQFMEAALAQKAFGTAPVEVEDVD